MQLSACLKVDTYWSAYRSFPSTNFPEKKNLLIFAAVKKTTSLRLHAAPAINYRSKKYQLGSTVLLSLFCTGIDGKKRSRTLPLYGSIVMHIPEIHSLIQKWRNHYHHIFQLLLWASSVTSVLSRWLQLSNSVPCPHLLETLGLTHNSICWVRCSRALRAKCHQLIENITAHTSSLTIQRSPYIYWTAGNTT